MRDELLQFQDRPTRHLEEVKAQIARCLENEVHMAAEERNERARRLGIDWLTEAMKTPRPS